MFGYLFLSSLIALLPGMAVAIVTGHNGLGTATTCSLWSINIMLCGIGNMIQGK